jgi:hypothetical protein
LGQTELIVACPDADSQLCGDFWISLASLLRSYTALHGLSSKRQATVEHDSERIFASCDKRWLDLKREGTAVQWRRTDGQSGTMEFTQAGSLRWIEFGRLEQNEEEMDMTAERWARDLMQELPQ